MQSNFESDDSLSSGEIIKNTPEQIVATKFKSNVEGEISINSEQNHIIVPGTHREAKEHDSLLKDMMMPVDTESSRKVQIPANSFTQKIRSIELMSAPGDSTKNRNNEYKIHNLFEMNFKCDSNNSSEKSMKNERKRNLNLRGIVGKDAPLDTLSISKESYYFNFDDHNNNFDGIVQQGEIYKKLTKKINENKKCVKITYPDILIYGIDIEQFHMLSHQPFKFSKDLFGPELKMVFSNEKHDKPKDLFIKHDGQYKMGGIVDSLEN